MRTNKLAMIVAPAILAAASLELAAADFAARTQLVQRSLSSGLGTDQIPLLKVRPSPGRKATIMALQTRFGTPVGAVDLRGTAKTTATARRTLVTTPGWVLEVAGSGDKVSYRNFAHLEDPKNRPVPMSQRIPQDQLEVTARTFITTQLKGLVRLGANEGLVPLFAEYQIVGGGSTAPGAAPEPETVAGANLVFGRTINGVHVIGRGSKIAVLFGSDGTIAGFNYDWANYAASAKMQKVSPIGPLRTRIKNLTSVDLDAQRSEVRRIECGYFDAGADRRDPKAPLQAACAIQTVTRKIVDAEAHARDPNAGHVLIAQILMVPAGEKVVTDRRWPLAQKFLNHSITQGVAPKKGPTQ